VREITRRLTHAAYPRFGFQSTNCHAGAILLLKQNRSGIVLGRFFLSASKSIQGRPRTDLALRGIAPRDDYRPLILRVALN
jgi:hypothetical protein